MTTKNRYHVVHDQKGWKVERENSSRASSRHETQSDAIDAARAIAQNNQESQVIIHRKDGKFREERTFGNDPYPPKG